MYPQHASTQSNGRISHLVVSWVLMIPLTYYASVGEFYFQRAGTNNALSQHYSSFVDRSNIEESIVTAILVFAVLFVLLVPRIKFVIELVSKDRVFASLAVLAMASCAWSQFPSKSFEWSICLLFETLFAFYLHARFSSEQLLKLLMLLGWICLVVSIVVSLFSPQYGVDHMGTERGAWMGMYGNKNTCSMMTSFLLPGAFFVPSRTLTAKCFSALYIGLSVSVILMTQSATGKIILASLLTYIVALASVRRFNSKNKAIVLSVIATVGMPLIALSILYSDEIAYALSKDPTFNGRTEIWAATMVSVFKRPALGYGYMAFWKGFQGEAANVSLANKWSSVYAHSGYLNLLTTLGAAGVALFLFSLIRALRDAMRFILGNDSSYRNWCLCVVLLTIVLNIDEVTIMVPNHLLWIMYMLACIGLSSGAKRAHSDRVEG